MKPIRREEPTDDRPFTAEWIREADVCLALSHIGLEGPPFPGHYSIVVYGRDALKRASEREESVSVYAIGVATEGELAASSGL